MKKGVKLYVFIYATHIVKILVLFVDINCVVGNNKGFQEYGSAICYSLYINVILVKCSSVGVKLVGLTCEVLKFNPNCILYFKD